MKHELKKFSQSTIEKILYYVYLLENPINNKIFYIGKGKGNRIFSHLKGAIRGNENSYKINTIKNILKKGKIPNHKIIRHGLTEDEAFHIEGALIDFYGLNNLTNKVGGHNSKEKGIMSINDIVINYEAKKIKIDDDLLLININYLYYYDISGDELYEATRKSWRLNLNRVKNIKYALSIYKGIVREVYEIKKWDFSEKINDFNRYKFTGFIANTKIRNKYIYKDVTDYFKKGSQNPIKYLIK